MGDKPLAALKLEDVAVGDVCVSPNILVDRDEAVAFASRFDPQAMHLDDESAASGFFGEMTASGWYTLSLTMGMMVRAKPFGETPLVGVRVDRVRFTKPVVPGMVLRARSRVIGTRRSSGGDRGYVTMAVVTETTERLEVLSQQWVVLLPTRSQDASGTPT